MILQADNAILAAQVIRKAEEILETQTIKDLRGTIIRAVASSKAVVLFDKKNGEVRGFLVAHVEYVFDEMAVFVKSIWYDTSKFNVLLDLMDKLKDWTKARGLSSMYLLSNAQDHENFLKAKFLNAYCIMKKGV